MTYDYNGCFGTTASPHAALALDPSAPVAQIDLNVQSTIQGYLDAGVEPSKITLGIPFYGRGYSGMACNIASPSSCLDKPFSWCPVGTYENGIFEKTDIDARLAAGTLTRVFNQATKTPYAVG